MSPAPHTLLIRLEAFRQSWGNRSPYNDRDTLTRPTKSGVIGLLAAADGHDRDEHREHGADFLPLADLASLRFGVRADRPGHLTCDFQTSGGGPYPLRPRDVITDPARADRAATQLATAQGPAFGRITTPHLADWYSAPKNIAPHRDTHTLHATNNRRHPQISRRWYLADAAFLAAVESTDKALLRRLAHRLDNPRRLLWLGRKHCAPTQPPFHGLRPGTLEQTLASTPLLPRSSPGPTPAWVEVAPHTPGATATNDQPVSYATHNRARAVRWEQRLSLTPPELP
ncbi:MULTISPECIES: type I-E CRISPR-associated protein Cas5/CasD [unclassified Streptomyces]|uniref:type I-E CRISPR-associated protein Cas5/CasD n=1 Tax=unclassified Streptomyces TaxID=2593676 RepID=UPI0033B95066